MAQAIPRTPREQLDRLLGVGARMVRYWWAAALVVVIGAVMTYGATKLRKPRFRSESTLLYREGVRWSYLGGAQENDPARRLGLRLKEMVLSRPRLEPIVEKHGLYPKLVAEDRKAEAVDTLRQHIGFRVRDGDTFVLSFEGEEPKVVQAVTQELAQALVDELSAYRGKQAEVTRDFLDSERQKNEEELKRKEFEMAQFLTRHPEFAQDTQTSAGTAVRAAEKEKKAAARAGAGGDPELLALEREQRRLRYQIDNPGAPVPAVKRIQDPRLLADKSDADAELTAARRDLADKQARFTEQHPDVRAAASRLKNAEARLRRATDVLNGAETLPAEDDGTPAPVYDRAALAARLARIENEIADRKRRKAAALPGAAPAQTKSQVAMEIVELETEWARLNREVVEARERYQQLEDKQFLAAMAATSEAEGRSAQMVIVDPAYRPTKPSGPGRMRLMAMGLLAAMAFAGSLALALALLDDRLYQAYDIERLDIAPVLVTVPRTRWWQRLPILRGRRRHG